jgi:hypothetical protein
MLRSASARSERARLHWFFREMRDLKITDSSLLPSDAEIRDALIRTFWRPLMANPEAGEFEMPNWRLSTSAAVRARAGVLHLAFDANYSKRPAASSTFLIISM